jgi:Raf kinase inhibitor-like YbhB/YbcL family protein
MKFRITCFVFAVSALLLSSAAQVSSADTDNSDWEHGFQLHSTTFNNDATLPLSTIANFSSTAPNSNPCTFNGEPGGNESPELSWTGTPRGTRSFVVIMYDVTASFTHWGMYNISGRANGLPQNAGVPNSSFGSQIANDYGIGDLSYDGPCPPTTLQPLVHHYVFTVYALNTTLPTLTAIADFQPGAEALYHELLAAAREGHILASASLSGFYSAAAPPGPG